MSRQKAKGTRFESAVVAYLRDKGFTYAERRSLAGARDLGDITGIPGLVVEVKNQERHSLAEWLAEAEAERDNAKADIGVVWFHRRGHASPGRGYVLMTGDDLVWLLKSAGYGPEPSPEPEP